MTSSVLKALAVLETLGQDPQARLSLGQISTTLGMPKSSVHRIVATLERHGYVAREPQSGRYRLGTQVLRLASVVLAGLELREHAHPHLERLSRELQDTVHLAVLDDGDVIYIDKIESPRRVQMISHVGGRAPSYCTGLGKAMLAHLPVQDVRAVAERTGLRGYTPSTITDFDELLAHLGVVRLRGYAIDQGEHESMVRCVAAPVRDYQGRVIAAISATTVVASWAPAHLDEMVGKILEAARAISYSMGWAGSEPDLASEPQRKEDSDEDGVFSEQTA